MIDRLAAAYGWSPGEIAALPVCHAVALLQETDRRQRAALADQALAVYAGVVAANGGMAGYRALLRWTEALQAETSARAEPGELLL